MKVSRNLDSKSGIVKSYLCFLRLNGEDRGQSFRAFFSFTLFIEINLLAFLSFILVGSNN